MNNNEFSNAMDVALNSYSLPSEFGEGSSKINLVLDEYEKSVFLTKAEDEIFLNLYNGKNVYGDYFESTEEMRRCLDNLVRTASSNTPGSELFEITTGKKKLSNNSKFFELPDELAFITLEQVRYSSDDECVNGFRANVYPIVQDEYARVKDNPFRGPTKYKVLRLDYGERVVELIPHKDYTIGEYIIKYLKKPNPIVLVNLPEDLKIHNVNTPTECEMDSILHNLILDRAVALAVQSKALGMPSTKSKKDE